jgi:Fur family transcriptional regulator, ferric uptake regulator
LVYKDWDWKEFSLSCEEIFLKELRARGYRLTPQREIVLAVMHHMDRPATVDDIFQKVQERSSSLDISTVYRTLDLLQEFGLVRTIDKGERQIFYEYVGIHKPHVHLTCKSCGEIIGVELEPFAEAIKTLRAEYQFDILLDNMAIPGLCQKCRSMLEPNRN